MYNLGQHYSSGSGVKRDLGQAAEYFAKAAEAGFVSAMVELGTALTKGYAVSSNPRRGVEWLQRAADAGSNRAKYRLGTTYALGAVDNKGGESSTNTIRIDLQLALLWFGRMADSGDSDGLVWLAAIMQDGFGLSSAQPEIAERYWRLAAYGGNSYAQVTFADRLRRGFVLVKQEYGQREAVTLLQRAMTQGSAQAALALAQMNRTGELGQEKSPRERHEARLPGDRACGADRDGPADRRAVPRDDGGASPGRDGEEQRGGRRHGPAAADPDEVERLERYYGAVDPATGQVKIRRLSVKLNCAFGRQFDRRRREWTHVYTWDREKPLWVWDWGRAESPTEFQFRNLERETRCTNNEILRRTLIDIFEQSKKSQIAFADMVDQKVRTAKGGQAVEPAATDRSRGQRRRRR